MKNSIILFSVTFLFSFLYSCSETEAMNQQRAGYAMMVQSLEYKAAQDTTKAPLQLTSEAQAAGKAVKTNETYTAKNGTSYTVYTGSKGGKFIIRKSGKTGNYYRQYLKD